MRGVISRLFGAKKNNEDSRKLVTAGEEDGPNPPTAGGAPPAMFLPDRHRYDAPKTNAVTLQASLCLFDEDAGQRYKELGIFADDTDIDLSLLCLLWERTGGLTARETRRLAAKLHDQNLISDFHAEQGIVRLHDTLRAYLRGQLEDDARRQINRALLDGAAKYYTLDTVDDAPVRAWWRLPVSADYLWRHLFAHLAGADLDLELQALAVDLRWSQAKLLRLGAAELDADLALAVGPTVVTLRQALPREVPLLGDVSPAHSHADILAARLDADPCLASAVTRFRAAQARDVVRLRPGWPLPDTPDPAALRVLAGHSSGVTGVAVAPDGTWLATTSNDRTVRIWDPATGTCRAALTGHTDWVTGVAIAPDGTWLATTSRDGTAQIWDPAAGARRAALIGHTWAVTGVAVAPDGTWLATTSNDRTVRIWDPAGANLATMRVAGNLAAVCCAPGARALYVAGTFGPYRFDITCPSPALHA